MEKPPCFGKLWEDVGESDCRRCTIKDACLNELVRGRLIYAQREIGIDASVEDLASELNIKPDAVALALQHQKNTGLTPVDNVVLDESIGNDTREILDMSFPFEWIVRWERERKRNPAIAKLKIGQTLTEKWPRKSDNFITVKVLKHRYLCNGTIYPTLYAVIKAVTGTIQCRKQRMKDGTQPDGSRQLVSWSSMRFFSKSFRELGILPKKVKGK